MDQTISDLRSSFLDRSSSPWREPSPSTERSDETEVPAEEIHNDLSRNEVVRLQFEANPVRAQEFLELLEVVKNGYCYESTLMPSKDGGYVQISSAGANKFATLGEMLLWASGRYLHGGLQISHRCNHPKCTIPAHVCLEDAKANNGRKGCMVWVHCPHEDCHLKIVVCPHRPLCIKYCSDYETWEEFLEIGVHEVRAS
jgi:hypothetical protein